MVAAEFTPKSTLEYASTTGLKAGGVGLGVSALQNAFGRHGYGATGIFLRTGGTIGFFAAMGATYAFTESYVRNTREVDDAKNSAAGGCAAGFLAGLRGRSVPAALGGCVLLGGLVGLVDYTDAFNGNKATSEAAPFFKTQPTTLRTANVDEATRTQ